MAAELTELLDELRKLNRHVAALHKSAEDIRVSMLGGQAELNDSVYFEPWFRRIDRALNKGLGTTISDLRAAAKEMDRRIRDAEVDIQAIRNYLQHGRRPGWIDQED